jgi:hypothetical protein
MPMFEQEWVSPILEVYKKSKIEETYTVILGLNPLGQALCRHLYEKNNFETVLIFNSPAFSPWNRYPIDGKALSKKGDRLLKRMGVPVGRADYYDGIAAPLVSAGSVAGLDPVVLFVEENQDQELILQVDDVSVYQSEIDYVAELLDKGLDMNLSY